MKTTLLLLNGLTGFQKCTRKGLEERLGGLPLGRERFLCLLWVLHRPDKDGLMRQNHTGSFNVSCYTGAFIRKGKPKERSLRFLG
jgi:hypothetical protein